MRPVNFSTPYSLYCEGRGHTCYQVGPFTVLVYVGAGLINIHQENHYPAVSKWVSQWVEIFLGALCLFSENNDTRFGRAYCDRGGSDGCSVGLNFRFINSLRRA